MAKRSKAAKVGKAAAAESRDSLENPSVSLYAGLTGMTDATIDSVTGASVTPQRAMRVVAFFACVKLLAETIASLPVELYEIQAASSAAGRPGRKLVIDDPRAERLAHEPNDDMTAFDYWAWKIVAMCVYGNAYSRVADDGQLWPIAPARILPGRRPDGGPCWIVNLAADGSDPLPGVLMPDEVLHLRGVGLDTKLGAGNVREARNALGISMSAEDYAGRMFANDGRPGAVYTTERPMTDEQFNTFTNRIRAGHEGLKNAHKFALLPPGVDYKDSGFDPSNLQMVEARKFQVREVARLLRIPPHMIGDLDGTATYASVEQMSIDFVTYTIRPWLVNIQHAVRRTLLAAPADRARGLFIDHDTSVLLRADSISRSKIDSVYRLAGIKTANEVREAIGLPPIEGGDVLWQPVNVSVVGPDGVAVTPPEPATGATVTPADDPAPGADGGSDN